MLSKGGIDKITLRGVALLLLIFYPEIGTARCGEHKSSWSVWQKYGEQAVAWYISMLNK